MCSAMTALSNRYKYVKGESMKILTGCLGFFPYFNG
jgi:hypothetical protein